MRSLGYRPSSESDLRPFLGPPLQDSLREILGTDDGFRIEEALRLYRERFATAGMFENTVYSGMADTLPLLLDEGYDLRVATSKPKIYADRIIDHFSLRTFFPVVYGSELSGERSDKADLIAYAIENEQVDRSETCMIGDRWHDIVGAKKHNLATVGVLWGYGTRDELRDAGADCLIDDVEALPSAVRGLTLMRSPQSSRRT